MLITERKLRKIIRQILIESDKTQYLGKDYSDWIKSIAPDYLKNPKQNTAVQSSKPKPKIVNNNKESFETKKLAVVKDLQNVLNRHDVAKNILEQFGIEAYEKFIFELFSKIIESSRNNRRLFSKNIVPNKPDQNAS